MYRASSPTRTASLRPALVAMPRARGRRASGSARRSRLCALLEFGHAPHQLVGRDVLHVARDGPAVAERVDDEAVAVAVELVLRGAFERGAELHGALDHLVDILDIDE